MQNVYIEPQKRKDSLDKIKNEKEWDLVIIGGGSVGAGILLDATLRGYKTLLLEKHDYAEGTSSRSSKLLHGGLRYLAQGNIKLIREALHERALVIRNAPHLAQKSGFLIPCQNIFGGLYYRFGLFIYDLLSGKMAIGKAHFVNNRELGELSKKFKNTKSIVRYYDGVFDDARLIISLINTAIANSGTAINYCPVEKIIEQDDFSLLTIKDEVNQDEIEIKAKCIIHTTGVWNEKLLEPEVAKNLAGTMISRGSHLVLDNIGMNESVLFPKTPDGRVLFFVPWRGKTIIGTTDISCEKAPINPLAEIVDVDWLIETANSILAKPISREDVRAVFTGFRPLVRAKKDMQTSSAKMSREHHIDMPNKRSVRIIGGKWTTYRKMAEDALDCAIRNNMLENKAGCKTSDFPLWSNPLIDTKGPLQPFLLPSKSKEELSPDIISAIEDEGATTIEDILSRRIRIATININQALQLVPNIAEIIANKYQWSNQTKELAISQAKEKLQQYQFNI